MSALATAIIEMPKKKPRPKPRSKMRYFTADQLERFLKAARDYGAREYAMFLFAVSHAARVQEIANLRLSDLNLKQGTIHIARLKGSLDSVQPFNHVKGNPLFNERKAFDAWLAERRPDAGDYVFNSQKSTQLDPATIYRLFQGVCEKAGIEDKKLWHVHVLKHTAVNLLVQANVNAFLIRQFAGHKSFQSTLAYVGSNDAQASHAAAEAFNKLF